MNNTVIEFNNVGKQYILGTIGTGTLSQDLNRWWANIRGKEDPYLKIGETNDRKVKVVLFGHYVISTLRLSKVMSLESLAKMVQANLHC